MYNKCDIIYSERPNKHTRFQISIIVIITPNFLYLIIITYEKYIYILQQIKQPIQLNIIELIVSTKIMSEMLTF